MARKIQRTIGVSLEVWANFKALAEGTGLSFNQCVERVMREAINLGEIPGIRPLDAHEKRENKKWGEATPVYDGEKEARPKGERTTEKRRPVSA